MLEEAPVATLRVTPAAPARQAVRRALGTPLNVAGAAALAGVAFVLARLAIAAKWDVTRFVMATRSFTNPATAPKGLHVFSAGHGYDGQFYYRLALDPADLHKSAFGIALDAGFRVQRIGFPVLSWLASGGQRAVVPYAEIGVNLAALAVLAYLGALIARDAGRHAAWGLLVAGFWGFLFSIGRDLPEVAASCLLVGGLLALRRGRPVAAGLLLGAAALTLETTLDVAIAIAVVFVIEIARGRRPGARDAAWVVPGVVFVAWQAIGLAVTGSLPFRSDAGDNIAFPFVEPVRATVHFLSIVPSGKAMLWLGELFVLTALTLAAAWALPRARVPSWEKLAWGISLLVAVSLAKGIWYGTANFRGFEDLYLFSVLVLIGSRYRRLHLPGALALVAWGVIFALRVHAM